MNSVRVYEFWGYDWWLPLWDAEMMDFWAEVPLELRKWRKLYIDYVSHIFSKVTGLENKVATRSANLSILKEKLKWISFFPLARRTYQVVKKLKKDWKYFSDPLSMYGIMGKKVFKEYRCKLENINSFLAQEIISKSYRAGGES